ncbi:hypothetical protein IAU60_006476 [Kwoniella sp. DSM 27419]
MPLMGNPSLANILYGPSVSFDLHVLAATQTVAAAVPLSTVTMVNKTAVAEQQKLDQTMMDSTMPRNLYLACGGLLVLCMIISHPRFLARLFASLHAETRSPSRPSSRYPCASLEMLKQGQVERRVAGGGLWRGWFLRRGSGRSGESACANDQARGALRASCKSDPFASATSEKFSNVSVRETATPPPHLYPPPHITPLLSDLPFFPWTLFTPFARLPTTLRSYLTVTQLYLIVAYLILIAFALVWKSDLSPATTDKGYGSDWMRSGLVATAQIPIVIALGVRGNIIGLCIGKGYERLKVFHKVVGRTIFLASTVHAAAYMYKWTVAGKFALYAKKPFAMWGILAYFALVLIVITSLPQVRKAWFGIFEVCHFVGIVGLLVGLALHVPVAVPFCVAGAVIYAISIFCSFTKTRVAHAELQALPQAGTTVITLPALQTGWRAGQHVRVRVPALGLRHGFECHPFTIASAPDEDGMVLMVKAAGDWTRKLFELAQQSSDAEDRMEGGSNRATVILEGPYGGLGNTLLPSFSSVLLVAGGSGITQALSLAHDLVVRAPTGVVRARTIDLVWMVRTEDIAKPVMPTLLGLVKEAKEWERRCLTGRRKGEQLPQPTALRVKIFVTRCPASSPISLLSVEDNPFLVEEDDSIAGAGVMKRFPSAADKEKYDYLCRNPSSASSTSSTSTSTKLHDPLSTLSVHPIRPNFQILVSSLADETIARHGRAMTDASGICVTACGPESMVADVRDSVRKLGEDKNRAAGGVEFEAEHFAF